jgi:hypothetical protein
MPSGDRNFKFLPEDDKFCCGRQFHGCRLLASSRRGRVAQPWPTAAEINLQNEGVKLLIGGLTELVDRHALLIEFTKQLSFRPDL